MGDLDAQRLLEENSKLKIQQNELSSVLGEEKEMVKYLHGVIKSYEQLLRSNSKRLKTLPRPVVLKRNDNDIETSPSACEGNIQFESLSDKFMTHPRKGDDTGRLVPLRSEQQRKKSPLSSRKRVHMKGIAKDSQGFSTAHREVNSTHVAKEHLSRLSNDLDLENLESSSASSDEESFEENLVSFYKMSSYDAENDTVASFHFEEESIEDRFGRFVSDAPSRMGTNPEDSDMENHLGRHRQHDYSNVHQLTSNTLFETKEKVATKKVPRKLRSNYATSQGTAFNSAREKLLQEMTQELDKMTSELNTYEKSLAKSEKRLAKMENKMEYLESFAFGEESEWL